MPCACPHCGQGQALPLRKSLNRYNVYCKTNRRECEYFSPSRLFVFIKHYYMETSPNHKPNVHLTWQDLPITNQTEAPPAIDWPIRRHIASRVFRWLERIALAVENPINKLLISPQLNPFYHTGTIAFFMLAVVFGTGLYLIMFYQYGAKVSYESVAHMEGFFVSRTARAVHRYASGGLVIFTLLHAIRMFFTGRFHGARSLAWVSGIASVAMIWLAGITGYWLVWDSGAQLISQAFLNLLSLFPPLAQSFYLSVLDVGAKDKLWRFMFLLVILHVGLSVLVATFYWLHIKRLSRPKFFPPQHWMIIMGASLVIMCFTFPLGMLPIADFTKMPGVTTIDLIFLFYLPSALTESPTILWSGVAALIIAWGVSAAIPWLLPTKKQPPIVVHAERCIGCGFCAEDCPYNVLTMIPREDGSPYESVAVAQPDLCVSCGICLGSCPTLALTLGNRPAELLWEEVNAHIATAKAAQQPLKIIFACERHFMQGLQNFNSNSSDLVTIPVICAGMLHPDLLTHAIQAGADEVQVVGCPADDCTNREGNLWLEERLQRKRNPKLRSAYAHGAIFSTWLPPDDFAAAVPLHAAPTEEASPATVGRFMPQATKQNFLFLAIFLAIGLILQMALTYVPYQSQQDIHNLLQRLGLF